jgi:hypothetical protein
MMTKNSILMWLILFLAISISCTNNTEKQNEKNDSLANSEKVGTDFSKYDRFYNDAARLLAGMPAEKGSLLINLDTNSLWKEHQEKFGGFFKNVLTEKYPKVYEFQEKNLKTVNDNLHTLFYPFSGPDFIYANIFFPNAKKTIMLGLEPVGNVPNPANMKDSERLLKFFKAIDIAMDSIFRLGYFMTYEMGRDFNRVVELNGTVPIISIFMVQTGHRILNIERVTINSDGELVDSIAGMQDLDSPKDEYISGGKITYMREGDLEPRELLYFSHDVSPSHLEKTPGFMKYLNSQDIDVTFLKAASYLMGWMDPLRNYSLEKSDYVFQDDSGIPYRFFDKNTWDFEFWGKYQRTLKVFKPNFQSDLQKNYSTDSLVKPLEFGIGYGIRINQSNLMLAKRKK